MLSVYESDCYTEGIESSDHVQAAAINLYAKYGITVVGDNTVDGFPDSIWMAYAAWAADAPAPSANATAAISAAPLMRLNELLLTTGDGLTMPLFTIVYPYLPAAALYVCHSFREAERCLYFSSIQY